MKHFCPEYLSKSLDLASLLQENQRERNIKMMSYRKRMNSDKFRIWDIIQDN